MEIITCWQPWASFIAEELKLIETREHNRFQKLNHKRIGIHAGLGWDCNWEKSVTPYLTKEQLEDVKFKIGYFHNLRGCILCTANVWHYSELNDLDSRGALIDCSKNNRYGLFLNQIIQFDEPIYAMGGFHRGVWTYDLSQIKF